jgi:hypothetical protein
MKSIGVFPFVAAWLLVSIDNVSARAVRIWPYQELLDKSDLVVIATPTATNDTEEHIDLPGFNGEHVVGVETRFSISAVLKADKASSAFVFHHYRTADSTKIPHVPNGPSFVSFDPPRNSIVNLIREKPPIQRTYILFLIREAGGRYAPVVGQADPGLGIKELVGPYGSPVVETQTKLGIDIANVLKQCQAIKPGMTRAELCTVFSTEGGLSTVTHRTFVYRNCPYIKVNVDFAPSVPQQDVEKPADIVTKISRPYLDWSVAD